MEPHRIAVKYFVEGAVDAAAIVPTFHRWIQEKRTSDRLLDVADYKHVQDGPHAVLVAHESDYIIDLAEGRPGLQYIRKRWGLSGSLQERLQATLRGALVGAKLLQDDPQPHGPIQFITQEVQISIFDRLEGANTDAGYEELRAAAEAVLGELYEGAQLKAERVGGDDARHPLSIKVVASQAVPLEALVERTEGATSSPA